MKKFKYLLAAGVCGMMLTGCLEDFQELNTNQEQLGITDPRNVFTGATQDFNNSSRAHLTGKYSGTMRYMQYLVSASGPAEGIYYKESDANSHPAASNQAYSDYYNTVGLRLNYLITNTIPSQGETAERYTDVGAIAQILLNYKQWQVLETYGAAPITEAFKAETENIRTPKYDLYQKGIDGTPMYKTIDAQIKAAIATLEKSNDNQYNLGTNDFFYKGDVKKWIKFANTLRVKMAQRLENQDKEFFNQVVSEVLTANANIISSNEESMIYQHQNEYNNNTDDIQDITSRYVVSAAFVNYLKAYNDPRLNLMVRVNGFGSDNNNEENDKWFKILDEQYPDWATTYAEYTDRYHGMSANPDSIESERQNNAYLDFKYKDEENVDKTMQIRMHSQIESRYFVKNGGKNGNNNMPAREIEHPDYEINQDKMHCFTPILTYPETCFMLAEIAYNKQSAVAGKDATAWFRAGIRASMEQYRDWAKNMYVISQTAETNPNYSPLTDEKIDAYLEQEVFQTNITLEKIISQQWVNLLCQPDEMYATWKRTGLPAFKEKPEPENGVAYLEEIRSAKEKLIIPRRNVLPTPNTLNIVNYNEAVKALVEDKSGAAYGSGVDQTHGRIWWDMHE